MEQVFAYRARGTAGELLEGEVRAPEISNAAQQLWEKNYAIISIKPKASSIWDKDLGAVLKGYPVFNFRKKVNSRELSLFCRQLATMLDAGVSLLLSLSILQRQKLSPKLKAAVGRLITGLEQGSSFAEGAKQSPDVFPPIFINMTYAGEMGGALDEMLTRLAEHFEKEHELTEKVKSAMTYPAIIFFVALGLLVFMLTFILPQFTALLQGLNVELPLITRVVMGLSHVVENYWYFFLLIFVISFAGIRKALRVEKNKYWCHNRILALPVFGELLRKREISRFSRTLATIQRSGVPIMEAIEVVKKTTANLVIRDSLAKAQQSIRDGQGLAEPLEENGVFPEMVVQMVRTGEETGTLEEMLEKVAVFYDREVDFTVTRLSSIIEPFFVVTLGISTGFILLAVLLPIFKVVTSVQ